MLHALLKEREPEDKVIAMLQHKELHTSYIQQDWFKPPTFLWLMVCSSPALVWVFSSSKVEAAAADILKEKNITESLELV